MVVSAVLVAWVVLATWVDTGDVAAWAGMEAWVDKVACMD